ncbi:MAG: hypothetical protein ABSA76_06880 [Bacteroidales bacterium]
MTGRFKTILKCLGISLFLGSFPVNAQLLRDSAAMSLIRTDIDYIYNLQFNNAREVYSKITNLYPGHPIVFLLNGMMTYWENYPLLHTSTAHVSFEEDLRKCIRLSETNDKPDYEAEYLLSNLCARGMLLMYYDDNKLVMEVTPLVISTYKYVRRAFDFDSVCTDLNYFTGLYNYYREAFPKAYPIYKSLALLFPPGNIETGLRKLQTASVKSIVLRAESSSLLTWIYLNFENNCPESLHYCKTLHNMYPENVFFLTTYIRNLMLMKQYDEAEKLMSASPEKSGNKYYQAQLIILKGILQEKKYSDNKLAKQYYSKGAGDISIFGTYGNEYAAYAYFGLSRISEVNGEKQISKTYRKEAKQLADFKKINFD